MVKNISYMQRSVLNEISKEYTTRDIADGMLQYLNKLSSGKLSIYDTHEEDITFRISKDDNITDDQIIKALHSSLHSLIEEFDDFEDIINDNYDFKYNAKYLGEGFLSDIITIRRTGKLIHISLDL